MPITKADSIRVDGLDNKESKLLIIKIAHEKKWDWWYDNEGKLIIDVDGSLKIGDYDDKNG